MFVGYCFFFGNFGKNTCKKIDFIGYFLKSDKKSIVFVRNRIWIQNFRRKYVNLIEKILVCKYIVKALKNAVKVSKSLKNNNLNDKKLCKSNFDKNETNKNLGYK